MTDSPRTPRTPRISVVTSHGRQELECSGNERLVDVLNRHGVPWSAVTIYAQSAPGAELQIFSGLDRRVDELQGVAELLLYFNRNVNPFIFSLNKLKVIEKEGVEREGSEYFYQRLDNARGTCDTFLKRLSPEECRAVIADRVADAVRANVEEGATLVVGVSGGGDSNALLHGLSKVRDYVDVKPVIIKGIPDWDAGVPRAQALADKYAFDLSVVEEPEVKALLGMAADGVSLIERFEREFVGDDFEFLGTLLIRLALGKYAREAGTKYIATGVNLEDIVCENLFRISSGMQPAAFPARNIGDLTLVFPLWLCPKRIIDGCFPKYSLENYDARYPCFSLGRNMYYSVVYAMQSQFPGFLEQFARGMSELSSKNPVSYHLDEQLGVHIERFVPFPLRQRFQKMLGRSMSG